MRSVGWAAAALDGRWAAIRIPALSQLVGTLLLLGGLVRAWDDLHTDRVATWFYVGGAAVVLGLLVALLITMSLRSAQAPSLGT